MQKKTKTYLLLVVVIIIWGLLIYKVVEGLSGGDDVAQVPIQAEPFNFDIEQKRDTFSIKADYRDPFLGTTKRKPVSRPKRRSTQKQTIEPEAPLPTISYSGYMTDPKNGARVFFININNRQVMLKPDESAENLKLLSGTPEQVKLRYGSQTLTIPISN